MKLSRNRVALVTGASHGIGAAIAYRLAADGFTVVINFDGNADAAAKVVDNIEKRGGRAISAQADVTDPKAVGRMFDGAEAAFGGVDVLVNNAEIMNLSPIAKVDDFTFDAMLALNLKGTFNGLREAAKRLREGGRIINISSSVVGLYQPAYGLYAATKAAVEAMTHVLVKELGSRQITVNAVAPGPVATEFSDSGTDRSTIDDSGRVNPPGRPGQAADIANVVALLVSPDGDWINGQVVRANGGAI